MSTNFHIGDYPLSHLWLVISTSMTAKLITVKINFHASNKNNQSITHTQARPTRINCQSQIREQSTLVYQSPRGSTQDLAEKTKVASQICRR